MNGQAVLDAEAQFFAALLAGDRVALDEVLAEDFALGDVVVGQVVPREPLFDLVGGGELAFLDIVRGPDALTVRSAGR